MPQAHLQGLGFALGVLRHCCKRCSIHHKTLTIAVSMLAHCVGRDHRRCAGNITVEDIGAAGPVVPHRPAAIYMDEEYLGRVKQVPSRPVVGASARPLGLSWQLTVAAVPMDLSCGHRSQRRQRALHRVILRIRGPGIIFWW